MKQSSLRLNSCVPVARLEGNVGVVRDAMKLGALRAEAATALGEVQTDVGGGVGVA
jgi:hypothetical protein